MEETPKIFISYSRLDFGFADRVRNDLQALGAIVWIDQLDATPGLRWEVDVEKALENCQFLLAVISSNSVASENVLDEVYYAREEKKTVIPLVIGECKIPYRLRTLQRIDFVDDYNRGLKRLLKALNIEKKIPTETATIDQSRVKEENKKSTSQNKPTLQDLFPGKWQCMPRIEGELEIKNGNQYFVKGKHVFNLEEIEINLREGTIKFSLRFVSGETFSRSVLKIVEFGRQYQGVEEDWNRYEEDWSGDITQVDYTRIS